MVTNPGVVAQVPWQRPILRRNDCDSGLASFASSLRNAVYFLKHPKQITTSVCVNVDVVRIVVIIVTEVNIESLISGNKRRRVHFILRVGPHQARHKAGY
jgi:hypothetical protein